jgi:hypothetical protein
MCPYKILQGHEPRPIKTFDDQRSFLFLFLFPFLVLVSFSFDFETSIQHHDDYLGRITNGCIRPFRTSDPYIRSRFPTCLQVGSTGDA